MGSWDQAAQGAAGGAMAGGAFGGPWGALAGGVLGGLGGYFGDDANKTKAYQDQLKALAAGYGTRTAPQMGPAAQSAYSGFRTNQAGLISMLEQQATGHGPSLAAQQMREAMDRAAGAQASAAAGAGGRGVNAGEALRSAMNNTAAIQSQGARDTAMARTQEQLNAINSLGQTIAQGRAADENTNQFNTGAMNDRSRANLEAKLRTMGMNDEGQLRALIAAMGGAQAASPGMGTQILAGGASAVPGLLQYGKSKPSTPMPGSGGSGGGTGAGLPLDYQNDLNSWMGG